MLVQKTLGIVIMAVCLSFVSCVSDQKKSTPANDSLYVPENPPDADENSDDKNRTASDSIDDLRGLWKSNDGTAFEYPFVCDGRTYLRYCNAWSDVTNEWRRMASSQGITMLDMWNKRFTLYSWKNPNTKKDMPLPLSDGNGIQMGIKFHKVDDRVYIREEILITEYVFEKNLKCFLLSDDGSDFRMNGVLHLFSGLFPDISQSEQIYKKEMDGNSYEK